LGQYLFFTAKDAKKLCDLSAFFGNSAVKNYEDNETANNVVKLKKSEIKINSIIKNTTFAK